MANHKTHYGVRVRSTRSTLYFYYEQRIAHTEIFRLLCLSLALYIVSAIRVVSAVVSIAIARARILVGVTHTAVILPFLTARPLLCLSSI
jgi:hypothetical protein